MPSFPRIEVEFPDLSGVVERPEGGKKMLKKKSDVAQIARSIYLR